MPEPVSDEVKQLWNDTPFDPKTDLADHPIPDGRYDFRIVKAFFGISGSGRSQIVYNLEVIRSHDEALAEKTVGKNFNKYDGMQTPENIFHAKKALFKLGLGDVNKDNIEEALSKLEGVEFTADAVTKGEFQNYHIRQKIDK